MFIEYLLGARYNFKALDIRINNKSKILALNKLNEQKITMQCGKYFNKEKECLRDTEDRHLI